MFAAALSVCLPVFAMIGCESSKTTEPGKARSEVMDLNDSPAAPIPAAGPRSTAAPLPPEPVEVAGPRKHVVAPKDTLYSLAKTYYGDSKQWQKIVAANPGLVPEKMPVGKTIIIP
jgi:nucleoid-associated protein YgaU